ncbi:hypothetical protein K488DRAFT_9486, partial [Vararia minispora EC-137]
KEDADFRVTFFPPLHEQRLIWLLSVLRREHVSSVLDVGCGEGALLTVLARPAPWLPDALPARWTYLHTHTLHGLDIDSAVLDRAAAALSDDIGAHDTPRWTQADARLWHGGLETINEAFVEMECIVASEVIEHLPPHLFPSFAPILLGHYAPRLLLLTTPSYTFNFLFRPPHSRAPWGYPDPTKRTDRAFRHADHKLEFTVEEWAEWCNQAAEEWRYDVEIGAIGLAEREDPWGRDKDMPRASQVAIFRRRESQGVRAARKKAWAAWAGDNLVRPQAPHAMRASFAWPSHAAAGKPSMQEDVLNRVKMSMRRMAASEVELRELWNDALVMNACGGMREVLVGALE